MPRFVLLYHDCPPTFGRPSHWDLMLESGQVLRTWALAQLPNAWQACHVRTAALYPHCPALAEVNSVAATRLGDHRAAYLEFEGPLSGDRGSVVRVESGIFRSDAESADCWQFTLAGNEICGKSKLTRLGAEGTVWALEQLPAG